MRLLLSIVLCCIIAFFQVTNPAAYAQSADAGISNGLSDVERPVIEPVIVTSSEAAASQVFTAEVSSSAELSDVTLYHRRAGQSVFLSSNMTELGQTTFYSATLKTKASDLRAIEYYIQARDDRGNRAISGFAFEPLVRSLTASPLASSETTSADTRITQNTVDAPTTRSVRWWHVALGVVAVGALAAASGGGSDGSSTFADGDTVPLTITLGEPQ